MSKMSELDYEQRMAADQPFLSLRESALNEMQALTESEYREDALVCLSETHQQLGEQLGEHLGEVGPKIGEQFGEQE
jgi:hypothetical protein